MTAIEQLDFALLDGYLVSLSTDIINKMLELYIQQSAIYLNEIQTLCGDNSQKLWQEQCHKMKSAAGSVGLKALHKTLSEMEKSTVSTADKRLLVEQLNKSNQESISIFQKWLNEKV